MGAKGGTSGAETPPPPSVRIHADGAIPSPAADRAAVPVRTRHLFPFRGPPATGWKWRLAEAVSRTIGVAARPAVRSARRAAIRRGLHLPRTGAAGPGILCQERASVDSS